MSTYVWFQYTLTPSLAAFTRMTATDDDKVIWKQWDPYSNVTETFVTGSTLTVEVQSACGLVYRKRYLIYIPTC